MVKKSWCCTDEKLNIICCWWKCRNISLTSTSGSSGKAAGGFTGPPMTAELTIVQPLFTVSVGRPGEFLFLCRFQIVRCERSYMLENHSQMFDWFQNAEQCHWALKTSSACQFVLFSSDCLLQLMRLTSRKGSQILKHEPLNLAPTLKKEKEWC